MKKMILTVALVIATFCTMSANTEKKDYKELIKIETLQDFVETNDSTPYIKRFYDVNRIVINNSKNSLIRIYDAKWRLLKETRGNVNIILTPGNYYVASDKKIKTKYIFCN